MRILHAIQELRTGGAERVLVALAQAAARRGHEVAVAAAPGALAEELPGQLFSLPLLGRRAWRVAGGASALLRAARRFRPHVLHAHNPGMAALAAPVTLRGTRPPALVSVQGVPEEDYPATARILRWSGLEVVACGPGVAAALVEHGCPVRATIPNSVSPAPPGADREALAREWRLRPGQPLLVAVGRLVPQKNHRLALHALRDVPEAKLVLVGDGPLRGELAEEARALGLEDRVVLAGERADARAVMAAADAVLLPSRWEGLPLAGLEALAAGTPLVATAVRGIREAFSHGRDALLVPDGDAAALAGAVRSVLEDGGLALGLAGGGRELVAAYSEERMVERFLDLYAELTAR